MNNDKMYNGWSNYETWVTNLCIDNDEGSQDYWNERAQEIYEEAEEERFFTRFESARSTLADEMKEQHEENAPTVTGVYADLLNASLGEVDWHEIANAILEENEIHEELAEAQ